MSETITEKIEVTYNKRGLLEFHLDNNITHPYIHPQTLKKVFGQSATQRGYVITVAPPAEDPRDSLTQLRFIDAFSKIFSHAVELTFVHQIKKEMFGVESKHSIF